MGLIIACQSPKNNKLLYSTWVEVRRTYPNGYVYNEAGQKIAPDLTLQIISSDSLKLYSKSSGYNNWVHFSFFNDSILNIARDYYKVKKLSKDTLCLQKLVVDNNKLKLHQHMLNMIFLNKQKLDRLPDIQKKTIREAQKMDTLYMLSLIDSAEKENNDFVLISHIPPQIIPLNKHSFVRVYPPVTDILEDNFPCGILISECELTVNHADTDMRTTCTLQISKTGNISLGGWIAGDDYLYKQKGIFLQHVLEKYLKPNFRAIPGSTLGIKHKTEILIHLRCNK